MVAKIKHQIWPPSFLPSNCKGDRIRYTILIFRGRKPAGQGDTVYLVHISHMEIKNKALSDKVDHILNCFNTTNAETSILQLFSIKIKEKYYNVTQ
jgi:hypothetical protein